MSIDSHLCLLVRQGELNLPVDTTGTNERWVERLDLVRGHDDLHVVPRIEAVQLVEQLQQGALDFTLSA